MASMTFDKGIAKKQIPMGSDGNTMTFFEQPSVPTEAPNHAWMEAYYDGKPDSWVPVIGIHWHKEHDEYHKVVKGKISFTLNGVTKDYGPEDGEIFVPRLSRHGFSFYKGIETLLRERTTPVNMAKQAFFEDLLEEGVPSFITALRSFYDGDTFLALPGGFRPVEVGITTALGAFATWWQPKKPVEGRKIVLQK